MPARALQSFSAQRKKLIWPRADPRRLSAARPSRTGSRVALVVRDRWTGRVRTTFSLRLLIEQRFGESPLFSIGVEEEVMILDAETLALAPAVELLIGESQKLDLPG